MYQIEFDGAAKYNPGPAGAGALVRNPDGSVVRACTSAGMVVSWFSLFGTSFHNFKSSFWACFILLLC